MIDGFRYGILGINDSNIISGMIILTLANIVSLILCMYIFKSGYKLKNVMKNSTLQVYNPIDLSFIFTVMEYICILKMVQDI